MCYNVSEGTVIFMEQKKIDRINELSKKHKSEGLTYEEAAERKSLHREYIEEFRNHMGGILENTYIQRPDGTKEKIQKKSDK